MLRWVNTDKRSINLGLGGQKWPWVKSLKCDRMKIWHLEKQQPAWRKSKFPRLLVQTIHLPVDSTEPETSEIRANIKQQESSSNMCLPNFNYSAGGCTKTALIFFNLFIWLHQVSVALCGLRCPADLSSLKRDWTHVPCIARQTHNHWTTKSPQLPLDPEETKRRNHLEKHPFQ